MGQGRCQGDEWEVEGAHMGALLSCPALVAEFFSDNKFLSASLHNPHNILQNLCCSQVDAQPPPPPTRGVLKTWGL